MKKVVSDEQRLANRKNAQKSTGPNTPKGKAQSARNALKHGLLAKDVVIHGPQSTELQSDFDALLADLIHQFQPRNFIEETLVERIATCYWRLRRVQRFEAGAVRESLETPDPSAVALDALRNKLHDAQGALDLETRLAELLDKPEDQRTSEESSELQESLDDFARVNAFPVLGLDGPHRIQHIRKALPAIILSKRAKVEKLHADVDVAQRDHALSSARRLLTAAFPDRDALLKVVRYENMLDRQIHRALAELRRLRKLTRYGTNTKKCTRKTKPFETDA